MKLSYLTAVSPLDGRYGDQLNTVRLIFSEYALLKFRVTIEIYWLKKISSITEIKEVTSFDVHTNNFLKDIINNFSENDALRIKKIEKNIKHDMKAVEYFLKEKISKCNILNNISEFIHFACTSEDINNLSYALMLKQTRIDVIMPIWGNIISVLKKLSKKYRDAAYLSRTHGQPATPSTMGKEIANVIYRMKRQYNQLNKIEILGKINGAVGNYNAHYAAYPAIDWHKISKEFVTSLGIDWNPYTTQIEPHDYIAELFDCIARFNTILIDFVRDIWGYIALNYFDQKIIVNEISSSTMPHKINPIYFENAEGNLGLANAMLHHLASKLPISRWQRDLSDSTVLRNLGVGISYSFIAYQAILKGLSTLELNKMNMIQDLNEHWELLAEPIQTVMRRYGIKDAYEKLKIFTRGNNINIHHIYKFIDNLPLPKKEKIRLMKLTPTNYLGYAIQMVDDME